MVCSLIAALNCTTGNRSTYNVADIMFSLRRKFPTLAVEQTQCCKLCLSIPGIQTRFPVCDNIWHVSTIATIHHDHEWFSLIIAPRPFHSKLIANVYIGLQLCTFSIQLCCSRMAAHDHQHAGSDNRRVSWQQRAHW